MLPRADPGGLDPRCDVKIRAEARVLLQPVLIVGFKPVWVSVPGSEIGDGAVDLVVIFEGGDAVILVSAFLSGSSSAPNAASPIPRTFAPFFFSRSQNCQ